MTGASLIDFGREICGDQAAATSREWLVVNGIGGFASGTISGELTRRYHGLLIAALSPPLGRTLLFTKVEEELRLGSDTFFLGCNRWRSGNVSPDGYRYLERFRLEGTTPVWTYACGDALLEKRIFMRRGENSTYVHYRLVRSREPLQLIIKVLANHRDYHGSARGGGQMAVLPIGTGLRVDAFPGAAPSYLLLSHGTASPRQQWYRGYALSAERERGLDGEEDHLLIGELAVTLTTEQPLTLVATTQASAELDGERVYAERQRDEQTLLSLAELPDPQSGLPTVENPPAVQQLILAADQFLVGRSTEMSPQGCTIIAGYPWFGDWGRDTMISLPGLCLVTGRPELARSILLTFSHFIEGGLLPNRFPDAGDAAEYNTADATLLYFEAIRAYHQATGDDALVAELFPRLTEIVACHERGTQHGIFVTSDGLLAAGEKGVQLTWMDAKVGDWVVTPRRGKPVEVNALWYNALCIVADFANLLEQPALAAEFAGRAARVRASFNRFVNPHTRYCFDVIDGPPTKSQPDGCDPSLRPNQLLAVSLPHSPLPPKTQKAVVDACSRQLLTSHGLRSLAPDERGYCGRYEGDIKRRDGAYHQGTAWSWLLGPFVVAHYRVYGDAEQARSFLQPLCNHLAAAGLGSISEIFDGDAPHTPRGCIAQAWSVGEWLRAYRHTAPGSITQRHAAAAPPPAR